VSAFLSGFLLGALTSLPVLWVAKWLAAGSIRRQRHRKEAPVLFSPRSAVAPTNGRVKTTGPRVRSARYVDERAHRNSIDKRDERQ